MNNVEPSLSLDFYSDNVTGPSSEIAKAMASHSLDDSACPYGDDEMLTQLNKTFSTLFERDSFILPVVTGTAANAIALSGFLRSYGSAYCHKYSHLNTTECGAPEFYSGGAKLVGVDGQSAKIELSLFERKLRVDLPARIHEVQPQVLCITQATELGTVYSINELRGLSETAKSHGMSVHMDGARFANALVSLACTPAELTWKAGVDTLAFGSTKNGTMCAEAVVTFDSSRLREMMLHQKRGGHLVSKMRFLSLQLLTYLQNGLWLRNARHSNEMAKSLAAGLADIPGVSIVQPVQANMVIARISDASVLSRLRSKYRIKFVEYDGDPAARLVTNIQTSLEKIHNLLYSLT